MIKFNNLTKSFNNKVIFNNANFNIPLNKITCVLANSGSGKTTLLNIIASLTNYEGEIENLPNNLSYVFQDYRLILNKTVSENLKFFTGVYDDVKIQKLLEKVGLIDKQNAYINTLSGGEKQRVNILRAILKNANLNLYDEPFTGLDLSLKFKVASLIKNETSHNGKTSIIVTHDVAVAVDLADEILFIDNGKVENYTVNKINGELLNEEKLQLITKITNRVKN